MPDTQLPKSSVQGEPFDLETASLRYLDGIIDSAQMAQLSGALKANQASRAAFVRICVDTRRLREIYGARNGVGHGEPPAYEFEAALFKLAEQASHSGEPSPVIMQPVGSGAKPDSRLRIGSARSQRIFYGIAAAILIMVMAAGALLSRKHVEQASAQHPAGIGSLASTLDAVWQGVPPPANTPLPETELKLASGFAILHFDNGARVVVQGPARFTPRLGGIGLADGALSALIPPLARGFKVQTGGASIVDLGTEFGVYAGPNGQSNLQVFKGRVSVQAVSSARDLQPEIVTENSALKVTDGAVAAIPFDASAMVRIGQVDAWVAAQHASPLERWKAWSERNRLDPDLIAHYTFDNIEHSSNRVPNLASTGASYDGTLNGEGGLPTWTAGRWGTKGALHFQGDTTQRVMLAGDPGTDRLDFSRGSETARPFTIAVWVKAAPAQIDSAALVSRGWGRDEQFCVDFFNGCFRTFVRGGNAPGGGSEARSRIVPNGQWQYVVAVYEPARNTLSLYLDGTLAAITTSAPQELIAASTPVSLGSRPTARPTLNKQFKDTLDGAIDEVAIWGRPLSPEQIRENYEAGRPE